MRVSHSELGTVTLGTLFAYLFSADWLVAASLLVLWAIWKLTATDDRMYVLPLALTFQWAQSTLGLFYSSLFGRAVQTMERSNYRPMVIVGLGCCLALAIGLFLGIRLLKERGGDDDRPEFAFSFKLLVIVYVTTIILEGSLNTIVRAYPSFRQIVQTFDEARLGVLYLLFRRLYRPVPRWGVIAGIAGFEVTLGITGFFAGFREPLVLAGLGMLEIFDRRNARHWAAATVVTVAGIGIGLIWMGIRDEYRRDYVQEDSFRTDRSKRISRISDLTRDFLSSDVEDFWITADNFVDRMWPIYYPALAMQRVPAVLPHTDGKLMTTALEHITMPRVFFPDKGALISDSEMVRKYSGVYVAGAETGTSIAFGYAAESYIDYGLPWMFAPVFCYALVMGLAYRFFTRTLHHRELLVGYCTVTFWLGLYLFERSWARTLGESLALIVYVGLPLLLVDRVLLIKRESKNRQESELLFSPTGTSPY
jgi:hypothetical protein